MKLATRQQAKEMDAIAITARGIDSLLLMERAAQGIVKAADTLLARKMELDVPHAYIPNNNDGGTPHDRAAPARPHVAIFSGMGNNGGDGVAAARLMAMRHWNVTLFLVGNVDKMTDDTAAMVKRLEGIPIRVERIDKTFVWEKDALSDYDLLVDALFGIGLCRHIEGVYAQTIQTINHADIPAISVDIPSGICADTGRVLGCAVAATCTVTFTTAKIGHFVDKGAVHIGELMIHDIGIPGDIIDAQHFPVETIDGASVAEMLPQRNIDGHKGDFGHDFILSGSKGYTGAPVLAAKACTRTGAGLVTVGVPDTIYSIAASKCLEEMVTSLPDCDGCIGSKALSQILSYTQHSDAFLIGPGLGRARESDDAVRHLLRTVNCPVVLDADGINAMAHHIDDIAKHACSHLIITPHDGEFARMGGNLRENGRLQEAQRMAKQCNCVLVLKGYRTIVAAPDGRVAINTTGNNGMATGGSGDVLSGMILAILGQGIDAFNAAAAAVWLHGYAGDLSAQEESVYSMTPSHLIEKIGAAFLSVLHHKTP